MKYQSTLQLRGCFGEYRTERYYVVAGMFINFIASILLARFLGLLGIVLGTILASLALWQGYFLIVNKIFFQKSLFCVWAREIGLFALASGEVCIAYALTRKIPFTVQGMLLCGMIGVLAPTLINLILFRRTTAFKHIFIRVQSLLQRRKK